MNTHAGPILGRNTAARNTVWGMYALSFNEAWRKKLLRKSLPLSSLNREHVWIIRQQLIDAENDETDNATGWISFDPSLLYRMLWWWTPENPLLAFERLQAFIELESNSKIRDFRIMDKWNWKINFQLSDDTWVNKVITFLTRVLNNNGTSSLIGAMTSTVDTVVSLE